MIEKIEQKLLGILAIIVSIIVPILCNGDITVSILMLPLGIYLLLTRKKVIY